MSTETMKVDVIAMLEAYENVPCTWGRNHDKNDIAEARDAVAELIEAMRKIAERHSDKPVDGQIARAALARVGGDA